MDQRPTAFWSVPSTEMLRHLESTLNGLTDSEAKRRISLYGSNLLKPKKRSDAVTLLFSQFKSPIILILLFATGLSFFLHDSVDALIILAIVLGSGFLGFWQERGAADAVEKLLAIVQIKVSVFRDGTAQKIQLEDIVPGDVVIINAGEVIPGDCLVLESGDLYIDEATLTGETYPVRKSVISVAEETPLSQRKGVLWMGTHVVSGSGKALVVNTGEKTEFGKVSERLKSRPQETEFEHGVRRFGYFLMEITLMLVITIFAINAYLQHPILDSFLFSLALAVGLTPQLLPAIITINLAHGAKYMAKEKVIVKRLASIENFGSMNVLCSDKTGTLTEGVVHLHSALNVDGVANEKVLLYAYMNAFYEKGFVNPIDEAIRAYRAFDLSKHQKLDEVPYDFVRKRLSVLIATEKAHLMITKGALKNILEVCSLAETADGQIVDVSVVQNNIERHFEEFSSKGFRTLGIAYRDIGAESSISKKHEIGMTFLGFLVLFDPPKADIAQTIESLKHLGISLKIITGDNRLVATNVSKQIGLTNGQILTGPEIKQMSDGAFQRRVIDVDILAEVEPNQKERIVLALRKAGNVVGYMGDGLNDASALHAADVSISVESAADVAKEAADIVLLEKDLRVLIQGVKAGRMTFANTLKYVFMATSANFGNMFSMAGASLFLPFLPLLPKQILLTNLMTDFPEMAIATDTVDVEMLEQPRRWDIKFIRKFMIAFGLLSSVFDFLTFGCLLLIHATTKQFRTGWFIESVASACLIVLVIRSRRPFFKSKPGKYLLIATMVTVAASLLLPMSPLANLLEFQPLPLSFLFMLGAILISYIVAAELLKNIFYSKVKI